MGGGGMPPGGGDVPQPQPAPPDMGGYSMGGMAVHRGGGAPPGVRPPAYPPMRQPMPIQPPRHFNQGGLHGVRC